MFKSVSELIYQLRKTNIVNKIKPKRRDPGSWILENREKITRLDEKMEIVSRFFKRVDDYIPVSKVMKYLDNLTPLTADGLIIIADVGISACIDWSNGEDWSRIGSNSVVRAAFDLGGVAISEGVEFLVAAGVTSLVGNFMVPAGATGGSAGGPYGAAIGGAGGAITSAAIGKTAGDLVGGLVGLLYDYLAFEQKYDACEGKTALDWAQDKFYDLITSLQ